jgi:H+/Cl- antiporter ClcA
MKYIISAAILLVLIRYWIERQKISKEDTRRFILCEIKVLLGFVIVGLVIYFFTPLLFKGRASIHLLSFFEGFLGLFYLPYLFIKYVLFAAKAWHGITGGKLTPKGNIILSGDWLRTIVAVLIAIAVVVIICFILWYFWLK